MKVVIVGGVAGGATAAARLRRLDESAEIVVFERGGYVSYANCGLPYYIGGVIRDRARLTLQTPESFRRRFNMDVRVRSEVVEIARAEKKVRVREAEGGREYWESYDKLVYAPGAAAVRPAFVGEGDRIFTLRTMEDQVMLPFDYDMACILRAQLLGKGIDLRLNSKVTDLRQAGDEVTAQIENASPVTADFAMLAIGVLPETSLAAAAGLTLGRKGAVVVDEHMRTSDPDIYAAGDAVQVCDAVTGAPSLVPLAGPANKQGRIAADNIAGIPSVYRGAQGSSVLKVFDMTAAATGLSERAARAAGLDADSALLFSPEHASYYPGGRNMTLKVVYERAGGRILGAQCIGFGGVEKRIDVLAAAVRAKMTAEDLTDLDLCYAPPYSSAKDPVNMAGYVIGNIRAGIVRQHTWQDVPALAADPNVLFLDVQTPPEYAAAHIDGAVNIPVDELRSRLGELDKSKTICVNCYSGLRSYIACRILSANGFACSNLAGGIRFYAVVAQGGGYDGVARHLCGLPAER